MKWTFIIREKLKVALLLGSIMMLVGFTTVMQQINMNDLKQSYSSIYYDRLIPATEIFYLTENLFNKRLLIEQLLYVENPNAPAPALTAQLEVHNDSIDAIIARFEETYLVDAERKYLDQFKDLVIHYNTIESNIIDTHQVSKKDAQHLYETAGESDLIKTIQFLGELTEIQSSVGLDLMNDSDGIISINDTVLTIQIAIAIVIGILIQALIFASKMANRKDPNYRLN
ncbi:MAG TPA: MCP four helix bundle domain-containing protein [Ohtaekwangia sp.]|nr:MCP four helix bundle domain-containing protein [Ohtaekwangia sp.]